MDNIMKEFEKMNCKEKNAHLGLLGGCSNCFLYNDSSNELESGCRIRLNPEKFYNLHHGIEYQIYDNGCKYIRPIKSITLIGEQNER